MTCFAFFHVIKELEHLEKEKKVEKKSPTVLLSPKTTPANILVYFIPGFSLSKCVCI